MQGYIRVYREVSVQSQIKFRTTKFQCHLFLLYHSYYRLFILILFSFLYKLCFLLILFFLGSVYSMLDICLVIIIFQSSLFFFFPLLCCVLLLSASDSLHAAVYIAVKIRNMFWITLVFHLFFVFTLDQPV